MPVPTRITDMSATAASNSPAGADSIGTSLDDHLRGIQQVIRGDFATKGSDFASAATVDLGGTQGFAHDVTGVVTITGFGTVAAGIHKVVKFEGALTLTHNATSMILPGAANITTANGDVGWFISEGSGNWRCLFYMRASGVTIRPFVSGTVVIFQQTAAPTGWTKITTNNDKALRIVSGAASTGGATAFSSVFGAGKTTGSTTLTTAHLPASGLSIPSLSISALTLQSTTKTADPSGDYKLTDASNNTTGGADTNRPMVIVSGSTGTGTTGNMGTGGGHTHTESLDLQFVDVIAASLD